MPVKWDGKVKKQWEKVSLGSDGEFEIGIRRLSFKERAALLNEASSGEARADGDWIASQIENICVDWKGVQDQDGKEIPFSLDSLDQISQSYDGVYDRLTGLVDLAVFGKKEADLKNSGESPTAASGTETPTKPAKGSMDTSDSPASGG